MLSLLVSACLEFVGFPMKRAEVGWLPESSFVFLLIAISLDIDIARLGQNLSFGRLTILASWGRPGGPWQQQEGRVSGIRFLLIFG